VDSNTEEGEDVCSSPTIEGDVESSLQILMMVKEASRFAREDSYLQELGDHRL
jgi:hypothetical protein